MNDGGLTPALHRRSDLPLAAASIFGFWFFYFLTIFARMAVLSEDLAGLGFRAVGCLVGTALTFLVYLVIQRAARESLRIKVIAAAVACIPAAAMFATFNLAFMVHQPLVTRAAQDAKEGTTGAGQSKVQGGRPTVMIKSEREEKPLSRQVADGTVTWYFLFASWAGFYIALSSGNQLRAAERRVARAERETQAAQLRALRYQVNPHFLFNTLNSLSSLVMARRSDEAEEMIVNLSTFYRATLTMDPGEDVTLKEEIGFQQLYLDIEQVRFPSRLIVDIAIPDDLADARVPPLILQPLVENAIKHGVAHSAQPVRLAIRAREEDGRLVLTVENGGTSLNDEDDGGTGTGLANVCARLAARFGRGADCEAGPLPGGGYRVAISMPLVSDA